MRKRRFLYSVLVWLLAISTTLSTTSSSYVLALEKDKLNVYSTNKILYYDPTSRGCQVSQAPTGDKITLIGDSISVGAQNELSSQIPGIDFSTKRYNDKEYQLIQVSKHFGADSGTNYSGVTIAKQLKEQHELRQYLIFALGTNDAGSLTQNDINRLLTAVGENQNIMLVTNASDGKSGAPNYENNNKIIREAAQKNKNIIVADWAKAIQGKESSYINDSETHVHLNEAGTKLFAQTIKAALENFSANSIGGGTATYTNYAGRQVLTESQIEAVKANQPIYEEVAAKYNFPWQILAVLHYRESNFSRSNPSNGQGIYQFYSLYTSGTYFPPGPVSDTEFKHQTDLAAQEVMQKAGGKDLNDELVIKRVFFGFNGIAEVYIQKARDMGFTEEQAQAGEGSPYVMNMFDEKRDPNSPNVHPKWAGYYCRDGEYCSGQYSAQYGSWVVFTALGGGSSNNCYTDNNKIVATAMELGWEGYSEREDAKPEYVQAMQKVNTYIAPCGSLGCPQKGASCDQFVSTVMRYSGEDPDFPTFGPGVQAEYMEAHPELYQEIDHKNDINNLMPGDIMVAKQRHIYFYIGEIDGKPAQASASNGGPGNSRSGMYFTGGIEFFYYDNYPYQVFRRIH